MIRKITALLLALLLVLSFAGCKQDEAEPQNETESQPEESGVNEDEAPLVTEHAIEAGLDAAIEKYNLVLGETFGAEVDYENPYIRLYNEINTEDYSFLASPDGMVEYSTVADIEYDEDGNRQFAGYYVDPSDAECFEVSNYGSMDEIAAELSKYMDSAIFEQGLQDNFCEFDGTCYLVRGGRGYGNEELGDPVITEKTDDTVKVSAPLIMFDEEVGTVEFVFSINPDSEVLVYLESAAEIWAEG